MVYDKIITRSPVNKLARVVTQKGEHFYVHNTDKTLMHWANMPEDLIKPVQNNTEDLSGKKFGRMTVVGYIGKINNQIKARWLVRCACGDYEVRKSSTITKHVKQEENEDMCYLCRKQDKLFSDRKNRS